MKGRLLHLNDIWNSSWNIQRLVDHIVKIIRIPDYALVPAHIRDAVNIWLEAKHAIGEATDAGNGNEENADNDEDCWKSFCKSLLLKMGRNVDNLMLLERMHLNVVALYASDFPTLRKYAKIVFAEHPSIQYCDRERRCYKH